jgi:hypothetical protein
MFVLTIGQSGNQALLVGQVSDFLREVRCIRAAFFLEPRHERTTSMRITATLFLLAALVSSLPAQVPVKRDFMRLIGQVPPPPASVQDAYGKTSSNKDREALRSSAAAVFESIDKETKSIEDQYKAQGESAGMPPGMSPDMMKKSQDPEMKKKMKAMSKEEKMKMAMEMMKSGAVGQPVVIMDPPPIRAALDEWQKIYNTLQPEFVNAGAVMQEEIRVQEEYEKGHAEIGDGEEAEIERLPRISSGEMSAPDPAQVKVVRLKAADKHIALANRRLRVIGPAWNALVEKTKNRYGAFYQKLMAANYALDSKNYSTKKTLADAQMMFLKDIGRLISKSRAAYEESARWMALRKDIERQ